MRTHFRLSCDSCDVSIPDFCMTVPPPGVPNQMRKRHREVNPQCPHVDDPPLHLTLVVPDVTDFPQQLKGLPADLAADIVAGVAKDAEQG